VSGLTKWGFSIIHIFKCGNRTGIFRLNDYFFRMTRAEYRGSSVTKYTKYSCAAKTFLRGWVIDHTEDPGFRSHDIRKKTHNSWWPGGTWLHGGLTDIIPNTVGGMALKRRVRCYPKTCCIYPRPQNTAVRVVVGTKGAADNIGIPAIHNNIIIPVVFHIPILYYIVRSPIMRPVGTLRACITIIISYEIVSALAWWTGSCSMFHARLFGVGLNFQRSPLNGGGIIIRVL